MVDSNAIGGKYTRKSSETLEESDQMNFDLFANNEQQLEMNLILFDDKNDGKHHSTREQHSAERSKETQIEVLKSQFHTNQILCKFEDFLFNLQPKWLHKMLETNGKIELKSFLL